MMHLDPRSADRVLIAFAIGFLLAGGYVVTRSLIQGHSGELASANLCFVGMFCGILAAIASSLASALRSWFGLGVRSTSLRVGVSGVIAAALALVLIALNLGRPDWLSALGFIAVIGTLSAAFAWIAERLRPTTTVVR